MDAELVRAPDYELWLRALAGGQRFAMVPEKLTNYRLHSSGVTHADPVGTYLEFAFILRKHMIPLLDRWGDQKAKAELFHWFMTAPQALELSPRQRFRILGYLATDSQRGSYRQFWDWALLDTPAGSAHLEEIGRNIACIFRYGAGSAQLIQEQRYSAKVEEARDWWHQKSQQWEERFRESNQRSDTLAAELRVAKRAVARAEKAVKAQQVARHSGLKSMIRRILRLVN
jgi:hypothetical protein